MQICIIHMYHHDVLSFVSLLHHMASRHVLHNRSIANHMEYNVRHRISGLSVGVLNQFTTSSSRNPSLHCLDSLFVDTFLVLVMLSPGFSRLFLLSESFSQAGCIFKLMLFDSYMYCARALP